MTFPLKIIGNLKSKVPPIPSGAIANWPGGSYIDISGSGYDGTPSANPPTLTTGINGEANGAFNFVSANSQDINFGDIVEIKNVTDLTISTWFNKSLGNNLLIDGLISGVDGSFLFYNNLQTINTVTRNGGVTNYVSGLTGLQDTWIHIVLILKLGEAIAADRFIQYINNTVQGGLSGPAPSLTANNANPLMMGSENSSFFSDGKIAQTLVYDRAITVEEVAQIYAQKT